MGDEKNDGEKHGFFGMLKGVVSKKGWITNRNYDFLWFPVPNKINPSYSLS